MHVVWVTVKVTPGNGDKFLESARRNHENTRREPGNLRFDVMKAADPAPPGEPELFFLHEVYRTREDFVAHQQTPHYHAFRDEVASLMAEPRHGVHGTSVYPEPWE